MTTHVGLMGIGKGGATKPEDLPANSKTITTIAMLAFDVAGKMLKEQGVTDETLPPLLLGWSEAFSAEDDLNGKLYFLEEVVREAFDGRSPEERDELLAGAVKEHGLIGYLLVSEAKTVSVKMDALKDMDLSNGVEGPYVDAVIIQGEDENGNLLHALRLLDGKLGSDERSIGQTVMFWCEHKSHADGMVMGFPDYLGGSKPTLN